MDRKHSIRRSRQTSREGKHVNALLIVDVQYDFIDGTLALKNCPSQHQGEQVIPILNKLLNEIHFDVVVYTQDWHTPDHISFYENLPLRAHLLAKDSKPMEELKVFDTAVFVFDDSTKLKRTRVEQILWPTHCVQRTHGADIHKDLVILKPNKSRQVVNLLKGYESDIDSYSAFWDNQKIRETVLNTKLKDFNVLYQVYSADGLERTYNWQNYVLLLYVSERERIAFEIRKVFYYLESMRLFIKVILSNATNKTFRLKENLVMTIDERFIDYFECFFD